MPLSTVIKLTYVEITGSRKILLSVWCQALWVSGSDISQDGHCREENTKTIALPLTGIPCAFMPVHAKHSQENIDR
jgi:hypothetical protein